MIVRMQILNKEALEHLKFSKRRIERRCLRVNQEFGPIVVETAQRFASGRPGPRIITGKFKRSIHLVSVWTLGFAFGSDEPQTRRLEYGFVGTDAMGREYAQPPYPSLRPAFWYWQGPWKRAMLKAMKGGVFRAR